jgi:hypothetical protein
VYFVLTSSDVTETSGSAGVTVHRIGLVEEEPGTA